MKITDSKHRLKQLLNDCGDSQNEMARKTGLTKSAISNYINGTREPRQDAILKISNIYKVNPAWLMGLDVPKESIESLQKKMVNTRLDYFAINENDEDALKENEDKFWLLHEDYEKVKTAMELYKLYENATPEARALIDSFLKSSQQES